MLVDDIQCLIQLNSSQFVDKKCAPWTGPAVRASLIKNSQFAWNYNKTNYIELNRINVFSAVFEHHKTRSVCLL